MQPTCLICTVKVTDRPKPECHLDFTYLVDNWDRDTDKDTAHRLLWALGNSAGWGFYTLFGTQHMLAKHEHKSSQAEDHELMWSNRQETDRIIK